MDHFKEGLVTFLLCSLFPSPIDSNQRLHSHVVQIDQKDVFQGSPPALPNLFYFFHKCKDVSYFSFLFFFCFQFSIGDFYNLVIKISDRL